MSTVVVQAPAKINIGLEILGLRDDGFHEIRTVMQTVSIYDRLRLQPDTTITLSCSTTTLESEGNLALRAVGRLRERHQVAEGARISLEKTIPIAAGLGGASSDAAAALRGACVLWSLACADTSADTREMAARLGSDVPFFLRGGTMLAEGRGERLTPLPSLADVWFVIASPRIELSNKTPRVYGSLQPDDYTDGASVAKLVADLSGHRPISWSDVENRFDTAAIRLVPEIEALRAAFRRAGAAFVSMTGAGPSHYTATADPDRATSIYERLTNSIGNVASLFLCLPIASVPPVEHN